MSGISPYAQSEKVRQLSGVVFDQKHRFALMAAIARSDDLVNPH
ncbi:hypothetical protein [Mycolicibacterium austroafricanum]|nr:hypothetical protein [Mycolicibacterium austroafricanum]